MISKKRETNEPEEESLRGGRLRLRFRTGIHDRTGAGRSSCKMDQEARNQDPYTFLGIRRYYIPDFVVEYRDGTKEIHETKGLPLLLWLSTKLKGQSAQDFCAARGWRYKQITKGRAAFYGKV